MARLPILLALLLFACEASRDLRPELFACDAGGTCPDAPPRTTCGFGNTCRCPTGDECHFDCLGECTLNCGEGALCDIRCQTSQCHTTCETGADCQIACNVGACDTTCNAGSSCEIACGIAAQCTCSGPSCPF